MVSPAERTPDLEGIEAQFQALYASGIIGILRADMERITDANDAFLALIGYSRAEMERGELRWVAMTPPEYADLDNRALQQLSATGTCLPFEKEYIRKDGTRVPILIAATRLSSSPLQWACYVLDLTLLKRSTTTDRTLAAIIEHVPVGIVVIDHLGRLVLMNEAGRQISGEQPASDEAVADQTGIYALREPGTNRPLAPEETPVARALAGEFVRNYEYVFRPRGARSDSWVRVVAVPLADGEGQPAGAVAVFEDVTEERLEERARDDFLSAAAHDLKTPLTSIKGFTQLLERRLARDGVLQPETAGPHLQRVGETVVRMEVLISELLDVARLQAGESLELVLGPVDLVELALRVAEQRAEASGTHGITVDTSESSVIGALDARRIERVVENLVGNAITYSSHGSPVRLSVSRVEEEGVPWAVLQVADNGIGIPARDLPRIFDRFYRGSNVVHAFEGTGIGLAGAKQVVEQHGGQISVESCEGAGSTFTVRLPLSPPS